ncbi:MAG: hypothetical protein CL878_02530 [Dehalococcoidia bacterium]|nr:hypothetical protein [Dehalococcoidia bacterium]
MESSDHSCDLAIIGAGPAGMAAALYASSQGMAVTLVNGGGLLGYGLHGAYKSKGMYELAKDRQVALKAGRGYDPSGLDVRFGDIHEQLSTGTAELTEITLGYLDQMRIRVVQGSGRFVDPHTIAVNGEHIRAPSFLIATGSRPRELPGLEVDGKLIMTSDHVVDVDEGFGSLTVVGAGVIGCEFASIFTAFGIHVTLLDTADRLLSHEDPDLSAFITTIFTRNGIHVRFGARTRSVSIVGGKVKTLLEDGSVILSDRVLVAIGRIACSDTLNLPATGIEPGRAGVINVNDNMQTTVPHIYAVGDVGERKTPLDLALVHIAEAEGRLAVKHMLKQPSVLRSSHIPFIIFSMPMIAGAGLTETLAREQYGDVRVAKFLNARNHRYHAMRSFDGYVKLIVGPPGDDRILGVRAVGAQADSVIGESAVMIDNGIPYTYLLDSIHAHPSLTESLQNAARIIAGGLVPTL